MNHPGHGQPGHRGLDGCSGELLFECVGGGLLGSIDGSIVGATSNLHFDECAVSIIEPARRCKPGNLIQFHHTNAAVSGVVLRTISIILGLFAGFDNISGLGRKALTNIHIPGKQINIRRKSTKNQKPIFLICFIIAVPNLF